MDNLPPWHLSCLYTLTCTLALWNRHVKKDILNSTLNQLEISYLGFSVDIAWTFFGYCADAPWRLYTGYFSAYMCRSWLVKLDKSRAVILAEQKWTIVYVKPTRNHQMDQLPHKTLGWKCKQCFWDQNSVKPTQEIDAQKTVWLYEPNKTEQTVRVRIF